MAKSQSSRTPEISSSAASCRILRSLAEFLAARRCADARICVGLSGGRDSSVLLHALSRLRTSSPAMDLSALHVHHGLSHHADAWAAHCAAFCADLGVTLTIVRVAVPRGSREGLEAAARQARHAAFARCPADWLALAHHRDDQAETVLFRLLRGTGVAGAAGMPAERLQPGHGARLIRPLLDVPQSVMTQYAVEHGLNWIEDDSNNDVRHRRNYLRHEVLPRIEAVFPGAAGSLTRAANHFGEAAALLAELASLDRQAVAADDGHIDLARFNALSAPRARNLLCDELRAAGFRPPQTRWIDEALRQLKTVDNHSEIRVATADGALQVYRGRLYLLPHRPAVPEVAVPWRGEERIPWGPGCVLFKPTIGTGVSRRLLAAAPVFLIPRSGGERLQPDPRRPRRALRKLFQDAALPPWERKRLPLLKCGEQVVWAAGIGVDAAFACPPHEEGLAMVWQVAEPAPANPALR